MAYEPTVWQAGDTITSARLNKLEQGVANGGGSMVVRLETIVESDSIVGIRIADATAGEILDAFIAGKSVIAVFEDDGAYEVSPIIHVGLTPDDPEPYRFTLTSDTLYAYTADDNPSFRFSPPSPPADET